MNVGVAGGARLKLVRSRPLPVDCAVGYTAVALVAQRVDARHVEQAGVLRTMRAVASCAAFSLDGSVLINEWPAHFGVALGADRVLIGRRFQVAVPEGAVDIVAVAALDESFVDLVVERHIKCRLGIGMALETKRRLRSLQQSLIVALVNGVTADAAYVCLGMRRAVEVGMRAGVAAEALLVHFLGRVLRRVEDLGDVATTGHVLAACAVAVLASDACAAVHQRHLGVRIGCEALGDFFVAGGASIGAHELSLRGGRCLRTGALGSCGRSGQRRSAEQPQAKHEHQEHSQSRPISRGCTDRQLRNRPISMHEKYRLQRSPWTAGNRHQQPFSG